MEDSPENRYNDYLDYYLEQSGSGIGYYSGRRYVPSGQEGDGLGDLFRAAKPALMGFAKRAGKSVLSAGASVLKDVIEGKNAGESAKNAFSEVGMSLLDDTVKRVSGRKRKAPGTGTGKVKKQKKTRNIFS